MTELLRARLLGACGYILAVLSVYGLILSGCETLIYAFVVWGAVTKHATIWTSVAKAYAVYISLGWIVVFTLFYASYNLLLGRWSCKNHLSAEPRPSKLIVLRNVFGWCCLSTMIMIASCVWSIYQSEHWTDGIVIPTGMLVEQVSSPEHAGFRLPRKPQLEVVLPRSSNGGGVYLVNALSNSGEAGRMYLKVFEAVRNRPLSEPQVSSDSKKRIAWSKNVSDTFFYSAVVDIHEGAWNKSYPARFELWFRPDDKTQPERKLLERIYSINSGIRGL